MKIALVTGASRGIGKGLADRLVELEYYVYCGVRTLSGNSDGNSSQEILLDVSSDESIQNASKEIKSKSGHLDLLINNAGLSRASATNGHPERVMKLSDLDRKALEKIFAINAISPVMVAKYMAPLMTEDNGFIINVSSIRSLYDNSKNGNGSYGYSSSKIALNMMTLMLAYDLPNNVSTFAMHPGSVKTDMNPEGSLTTTESAKHILEVLDNWDPLHNGLFLNYDGKPFNVC
jgi:NAD(P)-dependent dehydrogenase (short-subunit alcohol dehydrogenase family)